MEWDGDDGVGNYYNQQDDYNTDHDNQNDTNIDHDGYLTWLIENDQPSHFDHNDQDGQNQLYGPWLEEDGMYWLSEDDNVQLDNTKDNQNPNPLYGQRSKVDLQEEEGEEVMYGPWLEGDERYEDMGFEAGFRLGLSHSNQDDETYSMHGPWLEDDGIYWVDIDGEMNGPWLPEGEGDGDGQFGPCWYNDENDYDNDQDFQPCWYNLDDDGDDSQPCWYDPSEVDGPCWYDPSENGTDYGDDDAGPCWYPLDDDDQINVVNDTPTATINNHINNINDQAPSDKGIPNQQGNNTNPNRHQPNTKNQTTTTPQKGSFSN